MTQIPVLTGTVPTAEGRARPTAASGAIATPSPQLAGAGAEWATAWAQSVPRLAGTAVSAPGRDTVESVTMAAVVDGAPWPGDGRMPDQLPQPVLSTWPVTADTGTDLAPSPSPLGGMPGSDPGWPVGTDAPGRWIARVAGLSGEAASVTVEDDEAPGRNTGTATVGTGALPEASAAVVTARSPFPATADADPGASATVAPADARPGQALPDGGDALPMRLRTTARVPAAPPGGPPAASAREAAVPSGRTAALAADLARASAVPTPDAQPLTGSGNVTGLVTGAGKGARSADDGLRPAVAQSAATGSSLPGPFGIAAPPTGAGLARGATGGDGAEVPAPLTGAPRLQTDPAGPGGGVSRKGSVAVRTDDEGGRMQAGVSPPTAAVATDPARSEVGLRPDAAGPVAVRPARASGDGAPGLPEAPVAVAVSPSAALSAQGSATGTRSGPPVGPDDGPIRGPRNGPAVLTVSGPRAAGLAGSPAGFAVGSQVGSPAASGAPSAAGRAVVVRPVDLPAPVLAESPRASRTRVTTTAEPSPAIVPSVAASGHSLAGARVDSLDRGLSRPVTGLAEQAIDPGLFRADSPIAAASPLHDVPGSGAATARPGTGSADATDPRVIAAQLGEAFVSALPDGAVEITLRPEELGRVRMVLSPDGSGMTVTLMAERPETLDQMRRAIETLAADLRDLGYAGLNFRFDRSGHPGGRQGQPQGETREQAETSPVVAAERAAAGLVGSLPARSAARLDIRL